MTDLTLKDEGVHVERIYFDETCYDTSLPKLTEFYFSNMMPVLLQKIGDHSGKLSNVIHTYVQETPPTLLQYSPKIMHAQELLFARRSSSCS